MAKSRAPPPTWMRSDAGRRLACGELAHQSLFGGTKGSLRRHRAHRAHHAAACRLHAPSSPTHASRSRIRRSAILQCLIQTSGLGRLPQCAPPRHAAHRAAGCAGLPLRNWPARQARLVDNSPRFSVLYLGRGARPAAASHRRSSSVAQRRHSTPQRPRVDARAEQAHRTSSTSRRFARATAARQECCRPESTAPSCSAPPRDCRRRF
jgi:hypothetical protein